MNEILHNLKHIVSRIEKACARSGRLVEEVKLLLATKTVSAQRIKTALNAGQQLIGENKVQEIKEKYEELKEVSHDTHFIGHLQSNKIKDVLKYNVNCIQSLDRWELAEKLQHRLELEQKEIDVMIQVNTSAEESKFGVEPDKALELTRRVAELKNMRIKGLMTIGLFSAEPEKIRSCFRLLKNIQKQIITEQITGVEMNELSMGMSSDLEIAIEEGATIVRVGTAIFGKRIYSDNYYWNEEQ